MKVLILLISIVRGLRYGRPADENVAEYHLMCKIYRVVTTSPVLPQPQGEKKPEAAAAEILKTLDLLNYTTTDRALYDFISSSNELSEAKDKNPPTKDLTEHEWENLRLRFADLKKQGEGGWKDEFPRPPNEAGMEPLHQKIGRLLLRATDLKNQIDRQGNTISQTLKQVRIELLKAAFGSTVVAKHESKPIEELNQVEATDDSFFDVSSSSDKCVADASGAKAGKSLVSDIACLCGHVGTPNSANPCGNGVVSSASKYAAASTGTALWKQIVTKCGQQQGHDPQLTPENLFHLITEFNSILGKNGYEAAAPSSAAHAVGRQHILGVYHAGTAAFAPCDATAPTSSASHGICVSYVELTKAGKQIPWVSSILKAADKLRELHSQLMKQTNLLTKLELLAETALDFYHAATFEQKPNRGHSSVISTETPNVVSTMAESSNAVQTGVMVNSLSPTATPRFILPWTLLI